MPDPVSAFREAMRSRGIVPPADLIADGRIHRCDVEGKGGKGDAAYLLHLDGVPAGGFQNHKDGLGWFPWRAPLRRTLTASEQAAHRARLDEIRREREAHEARRQEAAAERAAAIWCAAKPAADDHSYLHRKKVGAHGLRMYGGAPLDIGGMDCAGALIVPARADGKLMSLQFIGPDEGKRFLPDGRTKGAYFAIGKPAGVICIAEGYATAATIHEATGHAAAVAFNCGNLEPVARALRAKFPTARLILCADDDYSSAGNPGLAAATAAAQAVGGFVAVPEFGADRPDGATDFNDLARLRGVEAVRRAIEQAATQAEVQVAGAAREAVASEVDIDAEIGRLAKLSKTHYEHVRLDAAKRLGMRTSALDREVNAARAGEKTGQGSRVLFDDVTPAAVAVPLVELLAGLSNLYSRCVVLPPIAADAAALWTAATWAVDHTQCAPILLLRSPEPRCGKSTLLSVLDMTVRRPLPAANVTPAALFRAIESAAPTLLIDEGDAFLRGNEELRGVINAGHTRATAYVLRTVGDDHEPRRFCVFGFKALALIGKAPPTITDRSIVIELRRKLSSERVAKLRDVPRAQIDALRAGLARWAQDEAQRVADGRPAIPESLNDRAADSWGPLLAVADLAGGDWTARARAAAVALSGHAEADAGAGAELLADVRRAFDDLGVDRIASADLLKALLADEERPWATYNAGKPLSQVQLARRLSNFRIASGAVRLPDGRNLKGYKIEQFNDAFARYLPATSAESVTPSQANAGAGCDAFPIRHSENVCRFEKPSQANASAGCDDVTLSSGEKGHVAHNACADEPAPHVGAEVF